nr:hypothetical protein [uncultured Capnocytophaga sp.]
MKNEIVLAGLAIVLAACTKKDDSSSEQPQLQPNQATLSVRIEEAFTDPQKDIKNILVNDYVPYQIEIKDSNKEDGAVYVLTPENNEEKHQVLNRDYELYLKNEAGTKEKVITDYIVFSSAGTHKFFIKPIVAGTFQHGYEIKKLLNGKKIGAEIHYAVKFSAVKVIAWSHTKIYDRVLTGAFGQGSAKYWRRFEFKIEDGNHAGDLYLTPNKGTQTYFAIYAGKRYEGGAFQADTDKYFHEETRTYDNEPPRPAEVISELHVVQTYYVNQPYEIVYYNIPIEERKE